MTTNRRGFFGMFAGLLSAIGLRKNTTLDPWPFLIPKEDVMTMGVLNQAVNYLENCKIEYYVLDKDTVLYTDANMNLHEVVMHYDAESR